MVTASARVRLRGRHYTRCGPTAFSRGRGGFTLIEMSIVILVIGVIVGGILVGRDLIHAAELRSVVRQIQQYDTAVMTFKDKYRCLPGDCPAAMDFGLGDASCAMAIPACDQQYQYANAGCNGNGDDTLYNAGGWFHCPEHLNLWYHLRQSALIADKADGRTLNGSGSVTTRASVFGVSAPATRLRNVGIFVGNPIGPDANRYVIGLSYNGAFFEPELYPVEAFHLDTKLDDGRPASGRVRISMGTLLGCGNDASFTTYNVALQSRACSIMKPISGFQ